MHSFHLVVVEGTLLECWTQLISYYSQLTPNGMVQVAAFDTPDGLYDCAWSEVHFLRPKIHLDLRDFSAV